MPPPSSVAELPETVTPVNDISVPIETIMAPPVSLASFCDNSESVNVTVASYR